MFAIYVLINIRSIIKYIWRYCNLFPDYLIVQNTLNSTLELLTAVYDQFGSTSKYSF